MKLAFYVLTQDLILSREDRLNVHEYVVKNWAKHCGNPVRSGDLLSYWETGNEFYLDYEAAMPVMAEFPEEIITNLPKEHNWDILTADQPEFEAMFKSNPLLDGLIDAFARQYVPEVSLSSKIRRIRYEPTMYTGLLRNNKDYTGPLFTLTMAYRTYITNEAIGKFLGRKTTKLSADGKLDHYLLFARPDFLRGIV